jgi:hypothetical protein
MTDLNTYLQDGANAQARAVLAVVQSGKVLENWKVTRWENCREQGYTIYKTIWGVGVKAHQLNITFCECRNTDEIIVYIWSKVTFNSPTLADINNPGEPGEWIEHTSKYFGYLKIKEAAEYITAAMEDFDQSGT